MAQAVPTYPELAYNGSGGALKYEPETARLRSCHTAFTLPTFSVRRRIGSRRMNTGMEWCNTIDKRKWRSNMFSSTLSAW
jgi:hypothetical protein